MQLKEIQRDAYSIANDKGLHDNLVPLPLREQTLIRLALVHTEVSEAMQLVKCSGVSSEILDAFGEELADVVIRVCELAEHFTLDLDACVYDKLAKNRLRPQYYGTPWEHTDDVCGRLEGP